MKSTLNGLRMVAYTLCMLSLAGCESKKSVPRPTPSENDKPARPTPRATAAPTPSASPAVEPVVTKPPANKRTLKVDRLSFEIPTGWVVEQPTSSMRKAQLKLPGAEAGMDAELVIFNFGSTPEAGGAVQANFDRWCSQFVQDDGGDTKALAKREQTEIGGMAVHTIDISGRYVAAVQPGSPEKNDKPDHRMLASIIISPEGKYFVKLLGPAGTIDGQAGAYQQFLHSLQRK